MNKQGQGLPLSTIVIAILVIIVLVLVVTFFLGGFAGLTDQIKQLFFGPTAGSSMTLAVQNCRTYCDQAKLYPSDTLKSNSVYCDREFKVDTDGDGEADRIYNCIGLGIECENVKGLEGCKESIDKPIEK